MGSCEHGWDDAHCAPKWQWIKNYGKTAIFKATTCTTSQWQIM